MQKSCPSNTVDAHAARIVAAIVVVVALLSLVPSLMWLSGILATDFFIRAWVGRRYSPIRWVAKHITAVLRLPPKYAYAPPKQFAARVGSMLTMTIAFSHFGLHEFAVATTLLLIVAASLEAFAGFCVACWLYPYVYRVRRV